MMLEIVLLNITMSSFSKSFVIYMVIVFLEINTNEIVLNASPATDCQCFKSLTLQLVQLVN